MISQFLMILLWKKRIAGGDRSVSKLGYCQFVCSHDLLGRNCNIESDVKRNYSHVFGQAYSGQIFALFILCKEAKKISKSLQRKQRNCERKIIKILTVFMLKLKDLIIYFSF